MEKSSETLVKKKSSLKAKSSESVAPKRGRSSKGSEMSFKVISGMASGPEFEVDFSEDLAGEIDAIAMKAGASFSDVLFAGIHFAMSKDLKSPKAKEKTKTKRKIALQSQLWKFLEEKAAFSGVDRETYIRFIFGNAKAVVRSQAKAQKASN